MLVQRSFSQVASQKLYKMDNTKCSICSRDLWHLDFIPEPDYHVRLCVNVRLSCGHYFHKGCLLTNGETCRICGEKSTCFEVITHYKTRNYDAYIPTSSVRHLDDKDCSICLEPWSTFVTKTHDSRFHRIKICSYVLLECGHIFHTDCLEPWLEVNQTCPNCRRDWERYQSVQYQMTSMVFTSFDQLN